MKNSSLYIVIPCYNEQEVLPITAPMFLEKIETLTEKGMISGESRVMFVNDGSRDKTRDVLNRIYNENKNIVQVVSFSRTFGQEAAMYAGMQASRGDAVCIIDADLQQRPEVAMEMLSILNENEDIDCVTAFQKKRHEGKIISWVKSCFYKV